MYVFICIHTYIHIAAPLLTATKVDEEQHGELNDSYAWHFAVNVSVDVNVSVGVSEDAAARAVGWPGLCFCRLLRLLILIDFNLICFSSK